MRRLFNGIGRTIFVHMYLGAVGISHPYTARVGHMEYTYCVYVVLQVASLLAVHGGSAVAQVRFLTYCSLLGLRKSFVLRLGVWLTGAICCGRPLYGLLSSPVKFMAS